MSFDARRLFELLPAVHRQRDARVARSLGTERGPQEELLAVFAAELGVLEENLEQLYDDLFIETCSEWVTPYIGDLIGYRTLHGVAPRVASPRAEVAHTIALRRRKGTALVLEQLARDVTGWNARAVEYFERLTTTQAMNHVRRHNLRSPDLRDAAALEWTGGAFESATRSVDVRSIESGQGRHAIPNVGLFLWRVGAHGRRQQPAVRVDAHRYRVSPLNHDVALFNHPDVEADITSAAEPFHVPIPLSRRHLARHLARHYGERPAAGEPIDNAHPDLVLMVNGLAVERSAIDICDLSDDGAAWAHRARPGRHSLDPELGRVALDPDLSDTDAAPAEVHVSWYEGALADLGGGEYERGESLPQPAAGVDVVRVPDDRASLELALADLAGEGVVEITDNGRYRAPATLEVAAGGSLEIRAVDGRRPTVLLDEPWILSGGEGSALTLNGLLMAGERLRVPADGTNGLGRLALVHSTLVPGHGLTEDGQPQHPGRPSIELELPDAELELTRSIVGPLRLAEYAECVATDSVVDATQRSAVALAGLDGDSAGGRLTLRACTVVGKLHASELALVTDCILAAEREVGDTWPAAVRALRKQVGCVRFSHLPFDSIVPRRYRCHPASTAEARRGGPSFTSSRYGTPAYLQLRAQTPEAIRSGSEDESEMGVLHHLYAPQRRTNLRIRLEEYLRVGLRAGIFYAS